MYYKKKESKILNFLKRNLFIILFSIIGATIAILIGYYYFLGYTGLLVIGITSLLGLIGHSIDSRRNPE
jgi:hypothetical protein